MAVGLEDPRGDTMVRRKDVAVKIDAEVVRQAKIVAAYKDVSLAEYMSEAIRPIVERDLREHSRKALEGDTEAAPPPPAPKRPKGGKP
jgi:hypothetical protein